MALLSGICAAAPSAQQPATSSARLPIDEFGPPFGEVAAIGIHAGRHGFMIENVSEFIVEVFEELPEMLHDP